MYLATKGRDLTNITGVLMEQNLGLLPPCWLRFSVQRAWSSETREALRQK